MSTLVISKNYKKMYELQKEHKWGKPNQDFPDPDDWVGKRVGIAGYGSIGRQGK
jgi:phosphoglycerate dehydrogenase-like enzyme